MTAVVAAAADRLSPFDDACGCMAAIVAAPSDTLSPFDNACDSMAAVVAARSALEGAAAAFGAALFVSGEGSERTAGAFWFASRAPGGVVVDGEAPCSVDRVPPAEGAGAGGATSCRAVC
jgi:hypothetical protein